MLTLESILAATKQQAAFGELPTTGVPRDRGAKPRYPARATADERAAPPEPEKTDE